MDSTKATQVEQTIREVRENQRKLLTFANGEGLLGDGADAAKKDRFVRAWGNETAIGLAAERLANEIQLVRDRVDEIENVSVSCSDFAQAAARLMQATGDLCGAIRAREFYKDLLA